ncbi:hypothetical protein A2U01_0118564, partial [Trifolium medium]|nr:hypothetical protein [Trifolium medium]
SEYELGMTAYNYSTAVMTDWHLPPYGPRLMDVVQEYDQYHIRHKQLKT